MTASAVLPPSTDFPSGVTFPLAGVVKDQNGTGTTPIAPKKTVRSIADARAIYERMRIQHGPRLKRFAKIQGMIDGNPYYNPARMKEQGLNLSNVNWKDAEAIYEQIAIVFWNLIGQEGQTLATFKTTLGTPDQNINWARIAATEWDASVRSWEEFNPLMQEHQGDLLKFGASLFDWPDEDNWQFDVVDIWKVLFPEETRNRTEAMTVVDLEIFMTPFELWDIYENPVKGWDREQIGNVLAELAMVNDKDRSDIGVSWMRIQQSIRDGSNSIGDYLNTDIQLVLSINKEYDGKVSKRIFHRNAGTDYLFQANDKYKSNRECMLFVPLTPGEKFVHGVRGIGHRIYNLIEGITKLDGHIFDAAKAASTVFLKNKASREKDGKRLKIDYGGIVDIGDADFAQSLIGSNVGPQIEVANYFRTKLQTNCHIYTISGLNGPADHKKSATEVAQTARSEARVQKNLIALYYQNLDYLFREMVRKMLRAKESCAGYEFVKRWKEKCIAQGVPKEFFELTDRNAGPNGLPSHMEVYATRSGGSGSQMADQIEMKDMLTLMPILGERGREQVLQDAIAAYRGPSYIKAYRPDADISKEPIAEDCLADGENNDMEQGFPRIVSPDNNHAVHCIRHMDRMKGIAQAYQSKQYDLLAADAAFENLGPHFTRHFLFLSRDYTRQPLLQTLGAQWRVIANFADMVKNNAAAQREAEMAKMQQAQEEAAKANTMNDPAMVKVLADNQRKMIKLQADMERNALRDQNKFMMDRMKLTFDAELDRARTMHDMAMENLKAANEANSGKESTSLF